MRRPSPLALPLLTLAAAAAGAQPPAASAPRTEERVVRERVFRSADGRDSVVRDTTIVRDRELRDRELRDDSMADDPLRDGPMRRLAPPGVWRFDGQPGDPRRVEVYTRREAPRSALGVYLGTADTAGVRVERVSAGGPAARAGVAAGDRIVAVNGLSLRVDRADAGEPLAAALAQRRLERTVGRLAPDSDVELRVVRDGRERQVRLRTVAPTTLADGGADAPRPGGTFRRFEVGPGGAFEFDGPMGFDRGPAGDSARARLRGQARAFADSARIRADRRAALGMTVGASRAGRDTLGLFVSAVATDGPAAKAGVVEGDRVAAINGVDLRVPRDERDDPAAADARRSRFTRELERVRPGDRVTLRVYGDGRWRTVTATAARAADVYRGGLFGLAPARPWGGEVDFRRGPTPMRMRMLAPPAPPRALRGLRALPPLPPQAPRALPLRRARVVTI